jgi:hypothetical protein
MIAGLDRLHGSDRVLCTCNFGQPGDPRCCANVSCAIALLKPLIFLSGEWAVSFCEETTFEKLTGRL